MTEVDEANACLLIYLLNHANNLSGKGQIKPFYAVPDYVIRKEIKKIYERYNLNPPV